MGLWILNLISKESLLVLTPWILILVGILIEKHFIGRVATFTNTMAINIHFSSIQDLNPPLALYANLGLLFGVVAIISYIVSTKLGQRLGLPWWYYKITNWAFSSIVTGILLLVVK